MKEPITLTIDAPITEHCSECDYEDCYSFSSWHVNCPKCGMKNSIKCGSRTKEISPVFIVKSEGSYNFANLSQKQASYSFYNIPKGHGRSYVIDLENDFDVGDPLECAMQIKEVIDRYLLNSDKPKIKELVQWLEENEDDQYRLRVKKSREKLLTDLYKHISIHGDI